MKKIIGSIIGAALIIGMIGCNSTRPRLCNGKLFNGKFLQRFRKPPPVYTQPTAGPYVPGPPPTTFPSAPPQQQGPVSPIPPPPNGGSGGYAPGIPPPVAPETKNYGPPGPQQVEYKWVPVNPPPQEPGPLPPKIEPPSAKLIPPILPPEIKKKKAAPEPKTPEPKQPDAPIKKKDISPFPVGIPQFSQVDEGVTTGLRPVLDGLDWLKDAGYKTVIHVQAPGSVDAGDKQQIEKRGMKYVALEASPATITKELVEQFNKQVAAENAQPMFVYDADGSLAGGLWYLYFRTHELVSDEVASVRASNLGFTQKQHPKMWQAVQKYLDNQQQH